MNTPQATQKKVSNGMNKFLATGLLAIALTIGSPQDANAQCDDCFPTKVTTKNDVPLKLNSLWFNEKDLYNDLIREVVSDGDERKQFDQIRPTLNLKRKATIFILMDQAKENNQLNISRAAKIYYCMDPDMKYSMIGGWVKKEVIDKKIKIGGELVDAKWIENKITRAEFNIPVYILDAR